jgi:hypothetical protein
MERITHNVHGVNNLASLRDTVLPRLISGQLRISDVKTIRDAER